MDVRPYLRRIECALGEVRAADGIREDEWFEVVMRELSSICGDLATEMQQESGGTWDKGAYQLEFRKAPPTRLLALEIVLAAWLGWVMHEKHPAPDQALSAQECLKMVQEAFGQGMELSKSRQRP